MSQAAPELQAPQPSELSQAIFMAYQVKWVEDQSSVKIMEKSRRIGLSYSEAADDVLYAASAEGANVYYISYNKEMTQGFIQDCATWAKAFNAAASQIEESVLEEEDKQILSFTINFDSGHKIQAFTSNPRNLRSKGRPGERLVIDEAAFVDDIKELLKAAMAMTMWGGQNVPYKQQEQVLFAICEALPRRSGIVIDSRGNGSYIGEAAEDKYGASVLKLMPTEGWYRDNMPGYKAAFEDGTITLPRHDGLLQDHRAFKLVRGVARIPEGKTEGDSHGDRAMACVYAHAAAKLKIAPIGYIPVPTHARGFDNRADPSQVDDNDWALPEPGGW
ncbi:UNVERIFIED_ORG: phage FluMu gp28-like protein [Comamonas terrigena]